MLPNVSVTHPDAPLAKQPPAWLKQVRGCQTQWLWMCQSHHRKAVQDSSNWWCKHVK